MYKVYVFPNSVSGLHPVQGCSDDYISPVVPAGVARRLLPLSSFLTVEPKNRC